MGLFYNGHKKLSNVNEFTKFDYSKKFTEKDAKKCLNELNIDLETKKYTALQFAQGMNVELEHGSHNKFTNVSNNDTLTTAKITLAHLNEFPDYYDRLAIMELDSEKFWRDHKVYVLENEEKSGRFKEADALKAAKKLNIPWENVQYDIHQLLAGMNVELEHGKENDITNVTDDDPIKTAKIALAHLNKYPDYYVRLEVMEKEGEEYWKTRDKENIINESALIEALSIADEEGVIVLEAASTKKYKCPYCEFREEKENLVYHVQDEHEDMIPENFTAARVVFNKINKKECGHCVVCNRETPWDENTWKYKRMCGRDACKKKAADQAKANMKKKYGKEHLLDDPEYQNKMLKGRKISGTYMFKGDKKEYVGSYEKNALEFIDKVLNCTPDEIQTPGPVIEYTYNGKKHFWITDIYYVTANLAIDCKDGGSNPNTREMKEYREKQLAKEKAITEQGKYNYLRLTDNDFEQLLLALVEIKKQMLDDEDKGTVIKINEYTAVGAMCNPVGRSYATYIVPYYINNSFIGTGYCSNKFMSDLVILGDDSKLKKISPKEFIEKYKYKLLKSSSSNDVKEKITEALEKNKEVNVGFIYEAVTGSKFINPDQLYIDSNFEEELDFYSEFALELECKKYSLLEEFNEYIGKPNMSFECLNESSVGSISYREDINGYYLYNSENKRRSKYYDSTDLIPKQLFEILRRDY